MDKKIKFSIGELVYLKTCPDQDIRMVIGINIRPDGVLYLLACGSMSTYHYDIEMRTEINQTIKLGLEKKEAI